MLQPIEESVDLRTCPVTLSGVPYQLVEMDGERHSKFLSLFAEDAQMKASQKDGKPEVEVSINRMEKMLDVHVKTVALCLQKIEMDDPSDAGKLKELWATSLENYRNGSSCQGINEDQAGKWLAGGLKAGAFVQESIVKAWPNPRIEQLYEAARGISGLNEKDEDDAKNSSEAGKVDGSDSPANSDSLSEPSSDATPSATS